jgi:hypothetical protein
MGILIGPLNGLFGLNLNLGSGEGDPMLPQMHFDEQIVSPAHAVNRKRFLLSIFGLSLQLQPRTEPRKDEPETRPSRKKPVPGVCRKEFSLPSSNTAEGTRSTQKQTKKIKQRRDGRGTLGWWAFGSGSFVR